MKIYWIAVYQTHLPYIGGAYSWGRGNAITTAISTVVVINTDSGIQGCGEFTPCGENYMIAYSHGVVSAARLIAPALLGEDPRQVARIEHVMDHTVQRHGYAKSTFDATCWDIFGKAVDQPVWMLLGGKHSALAPMYRVAPQKSISDTEAEINQYRESGYRQFQIKVGSYWVKDIERIRALVPLFKSREHVFADASQGLVG